MSYLEKFADTGDMSIVKEAMAELVTQEKLDELDAIIHRYIKYEKNIFEEASSSPDLKKEVTQLVVKHPDIINNIPIIKSITRLSSDSQLKARNPEYYEQLKSIRQYLDEKYGIQIPTMHVATSETKMTKEALIQLVASLADECDERGMSKEADSLDSILQKLS